jgi:hypothetical protein
MTDLVALVCDFCGSSDVVVPSFMAWDITEQDYRTTSAPYDRDSDWCNSCGSTTDTIERPLNLKELAQAAINSQEKSA